MNPLKEAILRVQRLDLKPDNTTDITYDRECARVELASQLSFMGEVRIISTKNERTGMPRITIERVPTEKEQERINARQRKADKIAEDKVYEDEEKERQDILRARAFEKHMSSL